MRKGGLDLRSHGLAVGLVHTGAFDEFRHLGAATHDGGDGEEETEEEKVMGNYVKGWDGEGESGGEVGGCEVEEYIEGGGE